MAFQLAAGPHTVAHLYGTGKVGIDGKVQLGGLGYRAVIGTVAQVLIHWRCVDDLIGVHQAVGIEGGLQFLEQFVDIRPEHLLVPHAPDDAVAVLPAEGAAKVFHQVADLVGDGHHLGHAFLVLETDHRPDVQAADAGVTVVGRFRLVVANDLVEPADKVTHVPRVDGRVLHKGQGLGVTVHAHQQPQTLLAHGPDAGLAGAVQHIHRGITVAQASHIVFQFVRLVDQLGFRFSVELHH